MSSYRLPATSPLYGPFIFQGPITDTTLRQLQQ